MSQFIELGCYRPSDPTQTTTLTMFNGSLIENPTWDDEGHIWFDYKGEQIYANGDGKKFKEDLLK